MNYTNNTCCHICSTLTIPGARPPFCNNSSCSCHKKPCHSPTQSWEELKRILLSDERFEIQLEQVVRVIESLLAKRDAALLEEIERMRKTSFTEYEFTSNYNEALDALKSFITNRDKKTND